MNKDSWIKKCREIVVEGHKGEVDHKRVDEVVRDDLSIE